MEIDGIAFQAEMFLGRNVYFESINLRLEALELFGVST